VTDRGIARALPPPLTSGFLMILPDPLAIR
jgi:hypothetical protein